MPVTGARVFVVDDDPAITQIYDEVLRGTGYDVVTAGSCTEAMTKLDEIRGDTQVLVVDLGLPDGDGADFVRDAAAKYGSKPTMYVSGWSDEFWQMHDAPGRWIIMRKPLPVKKLLAAVRWLIEGGAKPAELDEG
ncbi:MAG TPA: response regulator [Gemmatimonadaceae bacterium]|nr:response regulator [Gemmatimonadaceae bacterium]